VIQQKIKCGRTLKKAKEKRTADRRKMVKKNKIVRIPPVEKNGF
jgi:hypothetical protein